MNTQNTNSCVNNTSITGVCCDTTITHDISEEFTLPDYVNEVRRVLTTRAQVLPESKYIADSQSGTTLDFGGTVTYFVVYTDDEGKLCSTPLSSTYETQTVLKGRPSEIFIDTVPDSVTTRVSAPRRLTIKTRLKSRIFGYEASEVCDGIQQRSSADELFIERLGVKARTLSVGSATLTGIKISEKFDTPSLASLRPVLCDAVAILKDVKATNGSASCHGELIVKCLCESEGELIPLSRSVPIYEEIEVDKITPTDSVRAVVRCVSLSISSEESDTGAELFFDAVCEIDCERLCSVDIELTADAYSTKNAMETTYRDIELHSLLSASNSSFSINESVKRKSKEKLEIIDTFLDAIYERCEVKGLCAILSGRLCVSVIAKSCGEVEEYLCESYEMPFKYECELPRECSGAISRASVGATLTSIKYTDDKLQISAELYPSFMLLDKSSVRVLDSGVLKRDTEYKSDASCVRVFFPKDGDILWEIAKRYHTTREKIKADNSLDSDTLDGVRRIII